MCATGSLSGALSGLTELRTLNLTGNALTGTLPASLATLPKLQTLDLSNCTGLQARRVADGELGVLAHVLRWLPMCGAMLICHRRAWPLAFAASVPDARVRRRAGHAARRLVFQRRVPRAARAARLQQPNPEHVRVLQQGRTHRHAAGRDRRRAAQPGGARAPAAGLLPAGLHGLLRRWCGKRSRASVCVA